MRMIDRWAGVPACFTMTLLNKILPKPAPPETPNKILFIGLAEIGALVVAHPAMELARQKYEGCELYFMTFAAGEKMLAAVGVDDEHKILIRADGFWHFFVDTLKAIRRSRSLGIDSVVNLETFARFSTLLSYATGASRRVGFYRFKVEGNYTGNLLTHRVVYSPHHHVATTYASLLIALSGPAGDQPASRVPVDESILVPPRVHPSEDAQNAILEKIRGRITIESDRNRIILLNPNASDLVPVRRWPVERFLEVARILLDLPDVTIVVTGAPDEKEQADAFVKKLNNPRITSLAGRTTIPELVTLYSVSDLLITNDSGPAHFATVAVLPTVVLFGPETPKIFRPLSPEVHVIYKNLMCSPCVSVYNQKRSTCTDNQCMKQISAEEVAQKAVVILSGRPTPRRLDLSGA